MTIEELLTIKGILILVWLLLFFLWERIHSFTGSTGWPSTKERLLRLGRNLGLWLVNVALSPLIVVPLTLWATEHVVQWRPDGWLGGWLLDLLILDLWIYWWHRANHQLPLLWRFHRVHHLDQTLDVTSALRFHFAEVILSALLRVVVICLLGIPFSSVVVFEILLMVCTIFHHSDVRISPAVDAGLSKLMITPGIHWVHHHAIWRDTHSNYGAVLSCWDRLFRSRSATLRSADMKIGVEAEAELSLERLLLSPFSSIRRER